eukprot:SAG11_NODE_686_length_7720_cov_1.748327_2_plen_163_part_00
MSARPSCRRRPKPKPQPRPPASALALYWWPLARPQARGETRTAAEMREMVAEIDSDHNGRVSLLVRPAAPCVRCCFPAAAAAAAALASAVLLLAVLLAAACCGGGCCCCCCSSSSSSVQGVPAAPPPAASARPCRLADWLCGGFARALRLRTGVHGPGRRAA